MKKIYHYAGVTALALAISLSITSPAFAARQDRERDLRERFIRFIHKVQGIFGVGTNSDGITPPKP